MIFEYLAEINIARYAYTGIQRVRQGDREREGVSLAPKKYQGCSNS